MTKQPDPNLPKRQKGGSQPGSGRPEHAPTDKTRFEVSMMVSFGNSQPQIAAVIGISEHTLRLHYREELDLGAVRANRSVAMNLFKQATRDDPKAFHAAAFWLKTRAGWKEPPAEQRLSGSVGVFDASRFTDAELRQLETLLGPIASGRDDGEGDQGGGGTPTH